MEPLGLRKRKEEGVWQEGPPGVEGEQGLGRWKVHTVGVKGRGFGAEES